MRKIFVNFVALLVVMNSLFFSTPQASASTVDDLTDQPTTLNTSSDSNHKFTFTTTSSIGEGKTLTLTFPSAFDTSLLTEEDVDITAANIEISTGPDCNDAFVSVVIASDVVTLTRCTGSTALPSGVEIEIEIGTNAAAHGTGTNRITNPSSTGTYYIALGGTSGNEGSVPLPIGPKSGAVVAIAVTGAATNPGGGISIGGGLGERIRTIIDRITDNNDDDDDDGEEEPVDEEPVDEPEDPVDDTEDDVGGEADDDETVNDRDDEDENDRIAINIDVFAAPDLPLSEGSGAVNLLPGTSAIVVVTTEGPSEPRAITVVIGETEYVLSPNDNGSFSGIIPAPGANDVLSAVVQFADGSRVSGNLGVNVASGGLVYENIDDETVLVPDAVLTVYEYTQGVETVWNAGAHGQSNPVVTASGYFSWYVPNGTYVIYASKEGYGEVRHVLSVSNNILATAIELRPLEDDALIDLPPSISSAVQDVQDFLNTPEAETIANIALPATIAVATGTVTTLAVGFNLLPYLQYAFTSPLLLFSRRKRRTYGVVYNAMTKVPLELATVRFYRMPDNRLIKQVITSPDGRYTAPLPPGQYRIQVIKTGFAFPSQYLKDAKVDGQFLDIYSGQIIQTTEHEALVAANIPLDPSDADAFQAPRTLAFKRFMRSLQMLMAPAGVLMSLAVFAINPSIFTGSMIVVQIFVLLLVLRLAKPKKPRGWGIVYDERTHKPVGNAVIRIFEPKYNKLVETALTDSLGRYSFLLGPNEYFATYNKPGYSEKVVRPIDYKHKQEPTHWATNVVLQHASEEHHVPAHAT